MALFEENFRLFNENNGLCCQSVFELVEIVYSSIGLWGLYLIESEIQPEMMKKSFTRRDNTLTGSLII
jgi:hypothetical protein